MGEAAERVTLMVKGVLAGRVMLMIGMAGPQKLVGIYAPSACIAAICASVLALFMRLINMNSMKPPATT
jgi:hypothetical protein